MTIDITTDITKCDFQKLKALDARFPLEIMSRGTEITKALGLTYIEDAEAMKKEMERCPLMKSVAIGSITMLLKPKDALAMLFAIGFYLGSAYAQVEQLESMNTLIRTDAHEKQLQNESGVNEPSWD